MMYIELYVRYDDISKYNNGEEITVSDRDGVNVVLKNEKNPCKIYINVEEIINKEDHVSTGFINGTFNKFIIQKVIK